jgi:hypothetical protein
VPAPLRALALILLATAMPRAARADDRAAGWLSFYADSDDLTVVSPQAEARIGVGETLEVSAGVDIDVISAATVDVMTAASPRGYDETRYGARTGATWRPRADSLLAADLVGSWENDYRSVGAGAAAAREWIDRRLSTRADVRLLVDRVGRAGDATSRWRGLTTPSLSLGAAWIFDRATVGELTWELQVASGYQASPYRYVTLEWTDGGTASVPEEVPDLRVRHAAAARLRRALARRWFVTAGYRLYRDDWGVLGHTGELELQRAFRGDRVVAGLSARGHWQRAADFYRARYQVDPGMLPALRVRDKTLAESWSALAAARLELAAPRGRVDDLRAVAKLELYDQHFIDFPGLRRRTAVIVSLALTAEY